MAAIGRSVPSRRQPIGPYPEVMGRPAERGRVRAPGRDGRFDGSGTVPVAIDLTRLRGLGDDPDLSAAGPVGRPGGTPAELSPAEQLERAADPAGEVADAQHEEVEQPVIGHDRQPRADEARDELAGVGDEGDRRLQLEPLAVDLDRVLQRRHLAEQPQGGDPVRQASQTVLVRAGGRGHDPRVPADPGGDREQGLDGRLAARSRQGGRTEVDRPRGREPGAPAPSAPDRSGTPSAVASTLPVPAGTIANGIPLPASATVKPATVPSPPTATTSPAASRIARDPASPIDAASSTWTVIGARPVASRDQASTSATIRDRWRRVAQP